jgi:hypothetical protein
VMIVGNEEKKYELKKICMFWSIDSFDIDRLSGNT